MKVKAKVKRDVDWAYAATELYATIHSLLLFAATNTILFSTGQIHQGLTYAGDPQKANAKSWRDAKEKQGVSPNVPLIHRRILANPNLWLINGKPAQRFMHTAVSARVATGGKIGFFKSKVDSVTVALPKQRQTTAVRLHAKNYNIPFGPPPEIYKLLQQTAAVKFRRMQVVMARGRVAPMTPEVMRDLGSRATEVISPFHVTFRQRG
jgi:hypothetical protein